MTGLCLQSQQQVAVVYTDCSKDFDVVLHEKLFSKLYMYGIRGALLTWLQNFFTGCTHHTMLGGHVCLLESMFFCNKSY